MVEKYTFQESNENKMEKLVYYVLSLLLTNHKNNLSYQRAISKIIY
jgi:hypothetical protein